MKTLRLIGMALMAVLLNMSFSACSDDDDDENSGIGNKESLYGWEKVNGRIVEQWAFDATSENYDEFDYARIEFVAGGSCNTYDWDGRKNMATVTP